MDIYVYVYVYVYIYIYMYIYTYDARISIICMIWKNIVESNEIWDMIMKYDCT